MVSFKRNKNAHKKLGIGSQVRFINTEGLTIELPRKEEKYTAFECWEYLQAYGLRRMIQTPLAKAVTKELIELQDTWKLDPDSAPYIMGGTIIAQDGEAWMSNFESI